MNIYIYVQIHVNKHVYRIYIGRCYSHMYTLHKYKYVYIHTDT
jgi:hypothetical protein